MMRIEIDIQDVIEARAKQCRDGKYGVVEITEATCPVAPAVMRTTRGVKYDVAFERQFGGEDRAADGRRRTFKQTGKQRVFEGADLVARANVRLNTAFGVRILQRFDVGAIMKFEQLLDGSRRAGVKIVFRQPAEYFGKVHDGCMADDIERVIVTERGSTEGVAADENRRRYRGITVEIAHCLKILHAFMTECEYP